MDFGTYVRVRSIFFGVSVVFAYMSTHYALGSVAGLLVPSSLLIRGAPVAPPNTPSVFLPPACSSSSYEGVGFAACSARLGLRQSLPSSWCSSCSSWSSFLCRRGLSSLCCGWFRPRSSGFSVDSYFAVIAVFTQFLAFLDLRGFLGAKVTSHAELSSNVLMEPACHFMVLSRSDSKMLLFQIHWGDTDSYWSGYSSGSPLIR